MITVKNKTKKNQNTQLHPDGHIKGLITLQLYISETNEHTIMDNWSFVILDGSLER